MRKFWVRLPDESHPECFIVAEVGDPIERDDPPAGGVRSYSRRELLMDPALAKALRRWEAGDDSMAERMRRREALWLAIWDKNVPPDYLDWPEEKRRAWAATRYSEASVLSMLEVPSEPQRQDDPPPTFGIRRA